MRLHGLIVGILFCASLGLKGQKNTNMHPSDLDKFNLGFLMGINYNTYIMDEEINVRDEMEGTIARNVELIPRYGLSLGIITNFRITNNLSLRIIPAVSLEQRNIDFHIEGEPVSNRQIEATYFNVPVTLQFKSNYYNRMRVYLVGGGQFGVNFASNKKVRDDPNLLKIQKQDISLVVGAGITLYGETIKLSPEIRYSVGLSNIYVPEFTNHANAINSLMSQVISLNFNFE